MSTSAMRSGEVRRRKRLVFATVPGSPALPLRFHGTHRPEEVDQHLPLSIRTLHGEPTRTAGKRRSIAVRPA
ncbi:hypothetical protein GCM10027075_55530 [Streptomyces heilongjiangensis]